MIETENKKKLNAGRAKSMNKFAEALFSLMQTKSFDDITITDLSNAAGLVRKTFYRNFQTKEAIPEFKLDSMFGEIAKRFDFSTSGATDIYAFCFDYLLKNRGFTAVFTDRGTEQIVVRKIKEYIETAYAETLHGAAAFAPTLADYYAAFIADGILSVIRTWIKNDCKQTPAVMADLTHRLMSGIIS